MNTSSFSLLVLCTLLLLQAVFACELFQLQQNNTAMLPRPLVNIDYNVNTDSFSFSVKTPYLRDSTTWVIDFQQWNNSSRRIQIPAKCENRVASSFAATSLADHWKSAPFADSQDALGTMQFLAYGPGNGWDLSAASCNSVQYQRKFPVSELIQCEAAAPAVSCNTTTSTNSTRTYGTNLISVRVIPQTPFVEYSGTLHVAAVSPVYENETIVGYTVIAAYKYPFAFKLNTIVKDIKVISNTKDKYIVNAVNVHYKKDANTASIEYTLRTQVKSNNGDYLLRANVAATRYPIFVLERNSTNFDKNQTNSTAPTAIVQAQQHRDGKSIQQRPPSCATIPFGTEMYQSCVQEWLVYSSPRGIEQVATTSTGNFSLVWSIMGCAPPSADDNTDHKFCEKIPQPMPMVVQYTIASTIVEKRVDYGASQEEVVADYASQLPRIGGTSVKVSSHKTMTQATESEESLEGAFGGQQQANETDKIYMKQLYIPMSSQQYRQPPQVKIHNVWICFSENTSYVPEWNPSKNLTGCSKEIDQVLPYQNIRLLVKDSVAFYTGNDAFEPQVHDLDPNSMQHTAIFSFNLKPLTFQSSVYYIHVEYEVIAELEELQAQVGDGLSLDAANSMQKREVQIHALYVEQINWPMVNFEKEMNNSTAIDNAADAAYTTAIIATVSIVGVTGAVGAFVIVLAVALFLVVKFAKNSKKRNSTELLRPSQAEEV